MVDDFTLYVFVDLCGAGVHGVHMSAHIHSSARTMPSAAACAYLVSSRNKFDCHELTVWLCDVPHELGNTKVAAAYVPYLFKNKGCYVMIIDDAD